MIYANSSLNPLSAHLPKVVSGAGPWAAPSQAQVPMPLDLSPYRRGATLGTSRTDAEVLQSFAGTPWLAPVLDSYATGQPWQSDLAGGGDGSGGIGSSAPAGAQGVNNDTISIGLALSGPIANALSHVSPISSLVASVVGNMALDAQIDALSAAQNAMDTAPVSGVTTVSDAHGNVSSVPDASVPDGHQGNPSTDGSTDGQDGSDW